MTTSSRCSHYRVFLTTRTSRTIDEQFFGHAGILREWCDHPNSTYPEDGKQEKLPCEGELEKCTLISEAGG